MSDATKARDARRTHARTVHRRAVQTLAYLEYDKHGVRVTDGDRDRCLRVLENAIEEAFRYGVRHGGFR